MAESPAVRDYRKAATRMFTLIGQGPAANPLAIRVGYRELARLDATLGAATARALHQAEARRFHARTGLDPWTGERVAVYTEPAA